MNNMNHDADGGEAGIARLALRRLCEQIGLKETDAGGRVSFTGVDPVVSSRNRYGAATASALAAQGLAVAALWKMRSGIAQDVQVDLRRAVTHGLRSALLLRQNGHGFSVGMGDRSANFFRTKDGRLIYLFRALDYPHIVPPLLGLLRCANTPEDIAAAVAKWDAIALEDALADAGAFGVIARTSEEWLSHPQGQWLAARPGVEIEKIGSSETEPLAPADRPLSGLRVLDASHVIAGPAAGRLFAEQGANVLRVSAPHQPDPPHIVMDTGFGKRSAFIDLNRPEDVQQLRELAGSADIFIESWRPRAMARRGFSPRDLAALRPGIIYVSLSCYGSDGPWADRGGYEPIGQAACGLSVAEGSAQQPRNAPTVTMNDYLAAYLAVAGALAAVVRRCREGGSYHVKTSLTQSSMWVLAQEQLPDAAVAPALDAPLPADWMASTDSPFGTLLHAAPITQYSRTPAFWDRPPQPFGASPARW